ncbi:MAG: ATP-binding cassette domain-containing protein [Bacillota bacterium]
MLELRGLKKTYVSKKGTDCTALNNVNLAFGDTGLVFILGRSGSGKSTLMNAIGGLDTTDEGEIIINGTSNKEFKDSDFDSYRNTHIGFIFQEYNLMPEFNVYDNVALATELQDRKVDKAYITSLIEDIGLAGLTKRKISELSGGQKQRVSIARALSKDPNIILADEPTGNLDGKTSDQIFNILKELSKKKLIIVVTHDHESAARFGDRIITFGDGKVIRDTQNFVANFTSPLLKNHISKNTPKLDLKQASLPNKTAFRIALSSVMSKKIRLIFTILLVVVAVTIFGFGQVINNYDVQISSYYTMENVGDTSIIVRKGSLNSTYGTAEYDMDYISDSTMAYLQENYPDFEFSEIITLNGYEYYVEDDVYNDYLNTAISGLTVSSQEKLENMGYTLYGDYPTENDEVALNEIMAFLLFLYSPDTLQTVFGDYFADELFFIVFLDMVMNLDDTILADTYHTNKTDLLTAILTELNGQSTELGVFTSADLCAFVFEGFADSFLSFVNGIYIEGTYYDITGICSNNLSSVITVIMGDSINANNITMEQYTYLYNFNNLYNNLIVCETFAAEFFADGGQFKTFYLSKTVQNDSINMLQNVMIRVNAQWLARNPDVGEAIVIDGQTYVIVTGEVNLKDDEIIVSSNYFESIYKTNDEIDTTENLRSTYYPYTTKISCNNSTMSATVKSNTVKIVGVFEYYDAVGDYTSTSKYDSVSVEDRGYISSDMGMVVFVSDTTCETLTKVLTNTGSLWGNIFGDIDVMTDFWSDVGSFDSETGSGLMLYHANSTSDAVYTIYNYLGIAKTILTYIGYLMGIFSVALLFNFMSVSVMGKKREIGILRALGSRKRDVLKIFLIESAIICFFITALTMVGIALMTYAVNEIICYAIEVFLNGAVVSSIEILTLSAAPFAISASIIIGIIIMATAIPVLKISNMKPINAIKS